MDTDSFMNKVLSIFPEATVGHDNYGQLIIYTNMTVVDGQIVSLDEKE